MGKNIFKATQKRREISRIKKTIGILISNFEIKELEMLAELHEKWELDERSALASAKEEGEKSKSIEIATNMLKEGIEVKFIEKVTGLTKEEIEKLS